MNTRLNYEQMGELVFLLRSLVCTCVLHLKFSGDLQNLWNRIAVEFTGPLDGFEALTCDMGSGDVLIVLR